jgi:hypothetical protein
MISSRHAHNVHATALIRAFRISDVKPITQDPHSRRCASGADLPQKRSGWLPQSDPLKGTAKLNLLTVSSTKAKQMASSPIRFP